MAVTDGMKISENVCHLADIDAKRLLTLCVVIPKFSHCRYGVQAGILSQGERNNIERLGKCTEAVLLHASQGLRVLQQADCQLNLWCTSTSDQRPTEQSTSAVVDTHTDNNRPGFRKTQFFLKSLIH